MTSFILSQAREGEPCAARMVSVRAAVPLFGISEAGDALTYAGILVFIVLIVSLVHREIRKSRDSTTKSSVLEEERDILEKRIALRTRELITAETERLNELNRNAHVGELSRGLFHDLMSPLTSISLYIEKLSAASADNPAESAEARHMVENIVTVSRRMNSFMDSVRRSIGNAPELSREACAELSEEFRILRDILGYKARMADVELDIADCPAICLGIHSVRLHQLLSNLAVNAIDACVEDRSRTLEQGDKTYTVSVSAKQDSGHVTITVQDNGCGMTTEQVQTLFRQPSSTKSHGLGIGLKTVRSIVEDELHGSIEIKSNKHKGTTCIVRIPLSAVRS